MLVSLIKNTCYMSDATLSREDIAGNKTNKLMEFSCYERNDKQVMKAPSKLRKPLISASKEMRALCKAQTGIGCSKLHGQGGPLWEVPLRL